MPSITLSISAAKFTRLVAAVEGNKGRIEDPPETDGQLVRRWLRKLATREVFSYEKRVAGESILPDEEIVDE